MPFLTRFALEIFDNQHDFERMCADILNAFGYLHVVPIAPRGGSDGGKDITFTADSNKRGLACITLRKDIDKKFKEDFHQRKAGDYDVYYLFCNTYLTAQQKDRYLRYCNDTLKAEFIPQDVEAIRSLLDSRLKDIRRKYFPEIDMFSERGERGFDVEKSQNEVFYAYFDRMNAHLERLDHNPSVRFVPIMKAMTISTLKSLNSERNKLITIFLQESRLTQKADNVFALENGLLYKAVLGKVNLRDTSLEGADLRQADLAGADLANANLAEADLSGANLHSTVLIGANLTHAQLNNADLRGAILSDANLEGTVLEQANLRGANFSNARLHNTNLSGAKLNSCNFFQAEIVNSNLANTDLRSARFINATIRNSNLSHTFSKYTNFSLSELIDVDFRHAYLRLIVFEEEIELPEGVGPIKIKRDQAALFESPTRKIQGKARLRAVDFRNATIISVNFRGAILEDMRFDDSTNIEESTGFPEDFDLSSDKES